MRHEPLILHAANGRFPPAHRILQTAVRALGAPASPVMLEVGSRQEERVRATLQVAPTEGAWPALLAFRCACANQTFASTESM